MMLKKYPVLKWSMIVLTTLIVLLFAFGWCFMSLLPSESESGDLTTIQVSDLPYITQKIIFSF